jgi:hypothetical protein
VLLAVPAIALADNIVNSVDPTIDAVAETMPLNQNGANGTTTLYVDPTNGDGKNGCNFGGTTGTLQLAISSSDTSVATVSPSSVTFSSCGDVKTLTVTPHNAGTANINVTQTSNGTGATFNLDPAQFKVVVAPPANTAPAVTVNGVTGGASYNKGSVPAATCNVTDAEDGNSSFAATLSAVTGPYASDGIGSQEASCSYTDGGGLTASSSKTYSIVDPSGPVITKTVTGQQGNLGWYTGDVAVDWTVSDPQSPNSLTTNGCADFSVTSDQGSTTYTCTATSAGGTSTDSVTIKRDATAPTVTAAADRSADHNGWYNHALTVSFSGTDTANGSGNVTCDAGVNYSGPATSSHTISGSCADEAGNSAADAYSFKYDATAPTITGTRSPAANGFGWNNGSVAVNFTCGDNLSGVPASSCGPNQTLTDEGADQSSTGNATDNAGNTASATVSNIDIDLTDPSVSLNGGPANGVSYYFGSVPSASTCSASDALSGLDGSCSVSGYSTAVGSHTVTATATDRAGRTATATSTYTVLAWTTKGFYQPVDMGNDVLNTVKNGSTVPVKFELFAGPTELTSTSAVSSVTAKTVNCTAFAGDTEDAIEMVTTGGTSLRYDATGGQFIYNWQTPKKPNTCYNLTMTAADGSTLTAYFKLK